MTGEPLGHHKPSPFREHPSGVEPIVLRAFCTKVIDGDTYDLLLEARPTHYLSVERVRLAGVDTPEMFGVNAEPAGRVAKARVEELILGRPILVTVTEGRDKYGRLLVDVTFFEDKPLSLGDVLIEEGLGKPFSQ